MLRVVILVFISITHSLYGQIKVNGFQPMARYDKKSKVLIEQVNANAERELAKLDQSTQFYAESIIKSRDHVLNGIDDQLYIQNDSLENLVSTIGLEIIKNCQLQIDDPIFLVSIDPAVNASSLMIHVIEINIGVIVASSTAEELKMIIGHELAHIAREHSIRRIHEFQENDIEDKAIQAIGESIQRRGSVSDLEEAQTLAYALFKNKRSDEVEADSLSIMYMQKCEEDISLAVPMIGKIGLNVYSEPMPVRMLLQQLFTTKYPMRSFWFNDRLPIYEKTRDVSFIYFTDSIQSHPDTKLRMKALEQLTGLKINAPKSSHLSIIDSPLAFDLLQAAYDYHFYEIVLYLATMMRLEQPENEYLIAMITQIFIDLYQAHYDFSPSNNFYMYVNYYTTGFTKPLSEINAFLFNLSPDEMLEIAYHFLNNPETFNPQEEFHYWQMFQLTKLTEREELNAQVKKMYAAKFPEGAYLKEMR